MNKQQLKAKHRRKKLRIQLKETYGEQCIHHPHYSRTFKSPYVSKEERREMKDNKDKFSRFADPNADYALAVIGQFYKDENPHSRRW